jgi:hypothetical protein
VIDRLLLLTAIPVQLAVSRGYARVAMMIATPAWRKPTIDIRRLGADGGVASPATQSFESGSFRVVAGLDSPGAGAPATASVSSRVMGECCAHRLWGVSSQRWLPSAPCDTTSRRAHIADAAAEAVAELGLETRARSPSVGGESR